MSLVFTNATSNRVNCASPTTLDNLSSLTVMAWVYPTSLTGNTDIASKFRGATSQGWRFSLYDNLGDIVFEQASSSTWQEFATNNDTLNTDEWQFVAVSSVFGSSCNIYSAPLNGQLTEFTYAVSNLGAPTRADDGDRSLFIGNRDLATPGQAFPGRIAWVGIWNTNLTQTQIASQRYNLSRPIVAQSNCVLFMHLGIHGTGGVGTQLDWSGKGNNGTITGATYSIGAPIPIHRNMAWMPYAIVSETGVQDTQSIYAKGLDSILDNLPAYLKAQALASGNIELFLAGLTYFPFTDDFTGANDDSWNLGKWLTEVN